ncbi:MAG: hypothetical protein B7Z78_11280 [Rhodospirillales bacterium 20-60-12]|nr:MAG: hypothetical protein B7Z78_11280 [Rhodospirillales bacterium 20-60-12]HQT67909.1 DUF1178 family protein [Acetobacteraceae bacterium]HQU01891.1 DUF1178 family protein [Acetobacteraceae bacterium]
MIHYQLRCTAEHEFDSWFRDSAGFEEQAARGLVSCPACGSTQVTRALMAPALSRRSNKAEPAAPPAPPDIQADSQVIAGVLPDQVRAALQKLRAEVETHCDYVGRDFATVARKIHEGEVEPRGIYGEATEAEAEDLADDGIQIGQIPWIPRAEG